MADRRGGLHLSNGMRDGGPIIIHGPRPSTNIAFIIARRISRRLTLDTFDLE